MIADLQRVEADTCVPCLLQLPRICVVEANVPAISGLINRPSVTPLGKLNFFETNIVTMGVRAEV
jgi:hypothetical protein